MPEIGETIYYRRDDRDFVQKAILVGETSRSWLVGSAGDWWIEERSPDNVQRYSTKLPKKEVRFESEEAHKLSIWAADHRWKIRERVNFASADALKKIAEIIGYTEDKPKLE